MSSDPRRVPQLEQIQRWLQAVIMHPGGVMAGINSDEARSEVDVPPQEIERVVDPSQRRTSIERLEVYAHAYYARLLECLRDEFPALVHAVGDEVFEGLTFAYLQAYPSTSYTLGELSRRFPQFLEETRPRDEASDVASWPEFMIDLARLERTYSEVFDGPGTEKLELLKVDQLQAIAPEQWPDARLVTVPCLRLLTFRFPVHEYATGVRKKEDPPIPDPKPTWLAVSRIEYMVRRWPLSEVEFVLLGSLVAGKSVGQSIEAAATVAMKKGGDLDQLATHLRDWFAEWASAGFFQRIELPGVSG